MHGLVYIFTGTGKGKTSAALGMALRAICDGQRVAWIAWYKDKNWDVSEYHAADILGKNFSLYIEGKGFQLPIQDTHIVKTVGKVKVARVKTGVVVDTASPAAHQEAAQNALHLAKRLLQEQNVNVLVCDELCQAAGDGLVSVADVLELLQLRGDTHIILTGRNCPSELEAVADTVSNITKIKHAYDRGVMAVKGLDF